jgi:hypothetical protein
MKKNTFVKKRKNNIMVSSVFAEIAGRTPLGKQKGHIKVFFAICGIDFF